MSDRKSRNDAPPPGRHRASPPPAPTPGSKTEVYQRDGSRRGHAAPLPAPPVPPRRAPVDLERGLDRPVRERAVERQAAIIPIEPSLKRREATRQPMTIESSFGDRGDDTVVSRPSDILRMHMANAEVSRPHGTSAKLPGADAWNAPAGGGRGSAAVALAPAPHVRMATPPPVRPAQPVEAWPPPPPSVEAWAPQPHGGHPLPGVAPAAAPYAMPSYASAAYAAPPAPVHPAAYPPGGHGAIAPQSQYSIFEKLGLGKPSPAVQQRAAKALVTTYRLMGFGILTIIVVVLASYIATSAFYFVSDSWIEPMVVSPSDEKVLALNTQIADQANVRDKLAVDLAHTERYIAVQQEFQAEFAKAIRSDLGDRKAALGRLRALAQDYRGARSKIEKSNRAYASASSKQMANEYKAGLLDRGGMLNGKYQLAQITSSNLSLAERQADYETKAASLTTEARALDAILSKNGGEGALSYDVLRIKQEYELSQLETTKAVANRDALRDSLARQDAILASLRQSPYLLAASGQAAVAFVPYENLDNVEPGAPVYRCALGMIFCRNVGKAIEVMKGEVSFKHPQRDKQLRGQMVILQLEDGEAAHEDVLFVGGRPLLI